MNFLPTKIDGVYIVQPKVFNDERGYFFESYSDAAFKAKGLDYKFIQDNQSQSGYGTIRGLHFQTGDAAQAKLVRVIKGRIWDVAVDLRPGSPTYGQYVAEELDTVFHRMLLIPRGFAHGFSVLSDTAIVVYKTDNFYNKEAEGGIIYSDPDINIDWGVPANNIILSDKDKSWPALDEFTKMQSVYNCRCQKKR